MAVKNKQFMTWLRSLPFAERKDRVQKLLSGRVLNWTSARAALKKLQEYPVVVIPKLDGVAGMINAAKFRSSEASKLYEPEVACSSQDVTCGSNSLNEELPRCHSPCTSRDVPNCDTGPPLLDMDEHLAPSNVIVNAHPVVDVGDISVDTLPVKPNNVAAPVKQGDDQPSENDKCVTEKVVSPSEIAELIVKHHPANNTAQGVSETKMPLSVCRNSDSTEASTSRLKDAERGSSHTMQNLIDSCMSDMAQCICDTELLLLELNKSIRECANLPETDRYPAILRALLECSTLLKEKNAVFRSSLDKGVSQTLGRQFYPKLLQEINTKTPYSLYSSMRLATVVNMLQNLADPTRDPKFIYNSFVAATLQTPGTAAENQEPRSASVSTGSDKSSSTDHSQNMSSSTSEFSLRALLSNPKAKEKKKSNVKPRSAKESSIPVGSGTSNNPSRVQKNRPTVSKQSVNVSKNLFSVPSQLSSPYALHGPTIYQSTSSLIAPEQTTQYNQPFLSDRSTQLSSTSSSNARMDVHRESADRMSVRLSSASNGVYNTAAAPSNIVSRGLTQGVHPQPSYQAICTQSIASSQQTPSTINTSQFQIPVPSLGPGPVMASQSAVQQQGIATFVQQDNYVRLPQMHVNTANASFPRVFQSSSSTQANQQIGGTVLNYNAPPAYIPPNPPQLTYRQVASNPANMSQQLHSSYMQNAQAAALPHVTVPSGTNRLVQQYTGQPSYPQQTLSVNQPMNHQNMVTVPNVGSDQVYFRGYQSQTLTSVSEVCDRSAMHRVNMYSSMNSTTTTLHGAESAQFHPQQGAINGSLYQRNSQYQPQQMQYTQNIQNTPVSSQPYFAMSGVREALKETHSFPIGRENVVPTLAMRKQYVNIKRNPSEAAVKPVPQQKPSNTNKSYELMSPTSNDKQVVTVVMQELPDTRASSRDSGIFTPEPSQDLDVNPAGVVDQTFGSLDNLRGLVRGVLATGRSTEGTPAANINRPSVITAASHHWSQEVTREVQSGF